MTNKVIEPNLSDSDINFTNFPFDPQVEEKIRITLSYLLGQNPTDKSFHTVKVDGDGNLLLSTSASPRTTITGSNITVTTTATVIVSVNSSRDSLRLTNLSANTIYVGSSSGVTITTGLPIFAGDSIVIPNYTGILYGIVDSIDSDIRANEVS